jgi:hypothetical protein
MTNIISSHFIHSRLPQGGVSLRYMHYILQIFLNKKGERELHFLNNASSSQRAKR